MEDVNSLRLATEGPNSELFWTNGLNFWPQDAGKGILQGKDPTMFRHGPILELSGGRVELGDNICLVHFSQSRELRFSSAKTVHQF